MTHIPQPVWANILSYLHNEYDWEKKQVIDELKWKCGVLGEHMLVEHLGLVPQLLLPTGSMIWNVERSYLNEYIDEYWL